MNTKIDKGIKTGQELSKSLSLSDELDESAISRAERIALKYTGGIVGGLVVGAGTGLDIVPGAPGSKQLAKEAAERLAKEAGEAASKKLLKEAGTEALEGATKQAVKETAPLVDDAARTLRKSTTRTGTTPGRIPAPDAGPSRTSLKPSSYEGKVANVNDLYNVDNLNIAPEAKKAIQDEIANAGEQLKASVGRKLTNREVLDLASTTSKTLNSTITREQTAAKIAANLKLRQNIAAAADSGRIDESFVDLWIKDKAAGEDIARQLQARRIKADPLETTAIDALLESIYKTNKNADEIVAAAKSVDFNDPQQVTKFYRTFVKPKASEWLDLLRYNSMLSSPTTHMTNAFSNFQGTGILAPVEKTITGLVDATRAAITGGKREYLVGEGLEFAKGYYSSLKQATDNFIGVMKGTRLPMNPDTRSIPLATSGWKSVIEKTLAKPTRDLLEATDQFFTALVEGGSQRALQYRQAGGIPVKRAGAQASQEASERLFRAETKLAKQGHILDAMDSITNLITQARYSDNDIVATIARFTLPFVRTPTNILKQGVEYSPLGLSTLWGAGNKTEQVSKVIIGTSVAAGVATMLGQDRLTWAEPVNADQKADFRASGRQPYSVKIGDKWVSYSKLHPAIAFNFALMAALDDSRRNQKLSEDEVDSTLAAFAKWGNFVADQSYLKNIGDFVSATKGDVDGWTRYISNYPQQLIPFRALMSWVERLTDPVQRRADPDGTALEKQMQQIMAQIPGLAQKVPPRTTADGEPVKNNNRLVNALSPVRVGQSDPEKELVFQENREIQKRVRQQSETRADLADQAEDLDAELLALPKDEANTRLKQLKTENPQLHAQLSDVIKARKKGLDRTERLILQLGVDNGERAQYVFDMMEALPQEERSSRYQALLKKKVVTPEVNKQIRRLQRNNN